MKNSRGLVIALVVSIALNLVTVGIFVGSFFRGEGGPRPEMHRIDPAWGMRRLLGDLPEERTKVLAPLYRDYFSAMRPRFREIRGTQESLRAAMLTEPLDEAALRTALGAFQDQLTGSQRATQDAFVALAAELTLSERQQLVENMGKRPDYWRKDRQRPPQRETPRGDRPPYHQRPPEPPPQ